MRSHKIPRVLVALLALFAVGCAGGDEMQTFVPATYAEHGRIVMPVTFPDGTTAELLYPSALELAGFAIRPYSSGRLRGKSRSPGRSDIVARDFVIEDADVEDVLARRSTRPPQLLDRYDGVGGSDVGFWALGRADSNVHYLGFQFGRWAVLVYDYIAAGAMTDAERAFWAANFSGHKAPDGLLVLEGSGPLRLARAGDHAGPQLLLSAGPGRSLQLYARPVQPASRSDTARRRQARLVESRIRRLVPLRLDADSCGG